jgi:hypothetical protein
MSQECVDCMVKYSLFSIAALPTLTYRETDATSFSALCEGFAQRYLACGLVMHEAKHAALLLRTPAPLWLEMLDRAKNAFGHCYERAQCSEGPAKRSKRVVVA